MDLRIMRVAAVVALLGLVGCGGPLGPMSGGRLGGELQPVPASGWAFAETVETIQLETRPDDPYSVNVWCGVVDGELFVPTSLILGADEPTERAWVQNVLADANVRLRIDGTVYEAKAVRITDSNQVDEVRNVLLEKYEAEADEHSQRQWLFQMVER